MMVTTAVFTCSICGEASTNICAYCTKDACSNHRCERCKRCSDCCECEVPLSAEEAAAPEIESAAAHLATEPVAVEPPAVEQIVAEPLAAVAFAEAPAESPMSSIADFLTPEESSVFAEPVDRVKTTDVFRAEDPEPEDTIDPPEPSE